MNANALNETRTSAGRFGSQRPSGANRLKARPVSKADIVHVRAQLQWLIAHGFDYDAAGDVVERSGGWVHHVLHHGRFTITPIDVIAVKAAFLSAQNVYTKSRKIWELLQRINGDCVDAMKAVEEVSLLV